MNQPPLHEAAARGDVAAIAALIDGGAKVNEFDYIGACPPSGGEGIFC